MGYFDLAGQVRLRRQPHEQILHNDEATVNKAIEERKEYAKIIARAWLDEDFKKRLLGEPATVLKENGIQIPEGMTAKIVERKENEIQIPPPVAPKDLGFSVEELQERAQAFTLACVPAFQSVTEPRSHEFGRHSLDFGVRYLAPLVYWYRRIRRDNG